LRLPTGKLVGILTDFQTKVKKKLTTDGHELTPYFAEAASAVAKGLWQTGCFEENLRLKKVAVWVKLWDKKKEEFLFCETAKDKMTG